MPTPQERLRHAFSSDLPGQHDVPARAARARPSTSGPRSAPDATRQPELRVVGVGGAGVNAVNRMIEAEVSGVEFIALNTDTQSLNSSSAHVTLQIGADITRGLGSGSNPELGHSSAMEDYDRIKSLLKGSDMVFITAGEGGGTGTGAAPDRRARRARAGCADRRHRHQAVRLRGLAPHEGGRARASRRWPTRSTR